jgi:hypothetical protein
MRDVCADIDQWIWQRRMPPPAKDSGAEKLTPSPARTPG